jgi:hypothetical protein
MRPMRTLVAEDDAEAGQLVESASAGQTFHRPKSTHAPDPIQPSYKPYLGNEDPRRSSASNELALFED